MATGEPGWWYGAGANGVVARALAPAGWAYGELAAWRAARGPRYVAAVPVICVGNFTAGGTGKTPFVRVVVRLLRDAGHTPVVLSRGYGGCEPGPRWVNAAHDTSGDVGDEPLLLAGDAPVMIARDRVAGARAIAAAAPAVAPPTVIVMDDGLQNPALGKTLRIAVIDAVRGFGNGRCIPAGPLRTPLARQLAQVDAVLLNRGDAGARVAGSAADALRPFKGPVLSATITPAASLAWLAGQTVVAFAGIGVPQRFFATVAAAGASVCAGVSFPDHHAYSGPDARRLLSLASSHGAVLVTTEKDHVRLQGAEGALGDLAAAARVLPIQLTLDAVSLTKLQELLAQAAPQRR